MNRSEKDKRDAEREARRARRLSERADQRAKRQAEQAEIATRRAEELARKARARRSPRHRDKESIEDYVDDVAEKWSLKAEAWIDDQSRKWNNQSKEWVREQQDKMSSSMQDGLGDFGLSDNDYGDYGFGNDSDAYGSDDDYDEGHQSERRRGRRARRKARMQRKRARSGWKRRNRNGNLYKDSKNKKICGVCSGVADYWGMETWQVRLMAVAALFVVPSVAIPGYFITGFLLDDKPYYKEVTDRFHELDEEPVAERRQKSSSRKSRRNARRSEQSSARQSAQQSTQQRVPNAQALSAARQKFADIENRLRSMESHVTSPKFELQRELRKIAGDEV